MSEQRPPVVSQSSSSRALTASNKQAPSKPLELTAEPGVPVNKVISAKNHLCRPASDGRIDGKISQ
jgi:hypothetical protein